MSTLHFIIREKSRNFVGSKPVITIKVCASRVKQRPWSSDSTDTTYLSTLYTYMAMEGKWEDTLHFIAEACAALSSVRDAVEGERNLQGFLLAYLSLTNYYYTAPELELNHGFCDFFLLPDLTHYRSRHSYILELKYLPKKDYAAKAEAQWTEAVEQIRGYAVAPRVEKLRQGTTLHKIVMQFEGWELRRMEEID